MDKWRIFGAAVVCAAVLVLAACTPGREPVVTESPSAGVPDFGVLRLRRRLRLR